jgi:hypothetical protein
MRRRSPPEPGSALMRRLRRCTMHAGGPVLQCDPAPPKGATLKADLEKKHGDILVAQYTVKGIHFGVTIGVTDRTRIEKNIVAIADAIVEANALITDPNFRVKTCAIANATTRFATLDGASCSCSMRTWPTVRHELGHATFHFLRAITGAAKQPLRDVALQLTDIFRELAATKPVKSKTIASNGTTEEMERPAGLWIADPPQWSGSRKLTLGASLGRCGRVFCELARGVSRRRRRVQRFDRTIHEARPGRRSARCASRRAPRCAQVGQNAERTSEAVRKSIQGPRCDRQGRSGRNDAGQPAQRHAALGARPEYDAMGVEVARFASFTRRRAALRVRHRPLRARRSTMFLRRRPGRSAKRSRVRDGSAEPIRRGSSDATGRASKRGAEFRPRPTSRGFRR